MLKQILINKLASAADAAWRRKNIKKMQEMSKQLPGLSQTTKDVAKGVGIGAGGAALGTLGYAAYKALKGKDKKKK